MRLEWSTFIAAARNIGQLENCYIGMYEKGISKHLGLSAQSNLCPAISGLLVVRLTTHSSQVRSWLGPKF